MKKDINQKNYEDFSLILQEMNRFTKLLEENPKEFMKIDKWDLLSTIQNRKGRSFTIGQEGNKAFSRIAKRVLQTLPTKELIDLDILINTLKHLFCERIIDARQSLDKSRSDKIVSRAIKYIEANKLITLTHNFPCTFTGDNGKSEFSIGPVKFTETEIFLSNNKERLEVYSSQNDITPKLTEDLIEYYKKFPWIATVHIQGHESARSKEVAQLCIKSALNILKLFLPISYAEKVKFLIPDGTKTSADLISDEKDKLHISIRREFSVGSQKGWVKSYIDGNLDYYLQLLGSLINTLKSGKEVPLLYQRYLNALWWHSEALSHDLPYIKIISLANVLEALLTTSEIDIAEKISTRAAWFVKIEHGEQDDWEDRVRKFYKLRSKLVHGEKPAFAREVNEQIGFGFKASRAVLIDGIAWLHYLSKNIDINSLKAIEEQLDANLPKYYRLELDGISAAS